MADPQSASRNPLIRLLYGLIALCVLIYLFWPYATLARLWFALKAEDTVILQKLIDWPSVQQGLQLDVTRLLKKKASRRLSIADGQLSVSLVFEGTNISRNLAERLATPEALILLFNHPRVLTCIGTNIGLGDAQKIADQCTPSTVTTASDSDKQGAAGLEGPNITRIAEKTNYVFFTGLFRFKLSIVHDGVPIEIRLGRSDFGWKVDRIQTSFLGLEEK